MTTNPEAGMRLEREIARFREALAGVPDVQYRINLGQQFNAYDLSNDDLKAVCIGPITSRPLSLTEAPADVADLLEAALRLALTVAAAPVPPAGGEGEPDWLKSRDPFFIEGWRAARAQPPVGEVVAWRSPSEIPECKAGDYAYRIVAVRRAHNGKITSFAAYYLNAVSLWFEDDNETRAVTGWNSDEEGDDGPVYRPLLGAGDELMGWREIPVFAHPTEPAARDGGEADKMAHVLLGMVARGTVIDADAVEIGKYITFSESGEHGNAVVSPEISDGVYWTLIGSGPDWDQNRQAAEIVRRLNLPMTSESGLRPITMQDVRLAVGEGPLKPADVLAGCNAELVRRKALISPAGEVGPDEPILGLSAAPRGVEG